MSSIIKATFNSSSNETVTSSSSITRIYLPEFASATYNNNNLVSITCTCYTCMKKSDGSGLDFKYPEIWLINHGYMAWPDPLGTDYYIVVKRECMNAFLANIHPTFTGKIKLDYDNKKFIVIQTNVSVVPVVPVVRAPVVPVASPRQRHLVCEKNIPQCCGNLQIISEGLAPFCQNKECCKDHLKGPVVYCKD